MLRTKILLFVVALAPITASALTSPDKFPVGEKKFSGYVAGTLSSNAFQPSESNSDQSMDLTFSLTYLLKNKDRLEFRTGASQQINHGRENTLSDSLIGYTFDTWFSHGDDITSDLTFRATLPTSEAAQDRRQIGSLSALAPLSWSATDQISVLYLPRISRHVYEYESPVNGGANFVEWDVLNHVAAYYRLSDKWLLSANTYFISQKPFNEDWRALRFGNGFTAQYTVMKTARISAGYSNRGAIYSTDRGPDEVYNLYDRNSATYFVSYTHSF